MVSGENLSFIAEKFSVGLDKLVELNQLSDPDKIEVGQKLKIPAELSGTHGIREVSGLPTTGTITSRYGMRRGRMHYGLDISNKLGTPIYSVNKGFVVASGWMRGFGKTIKIKSNQYLYIYAHLQERLVRKGMVVKKGQLIGKMGSTGRSSGNHLHFEVRKNNEPINPFAYFGKFDNGSMDKVIGLKRIDN